MPTPQKSENLSDLRLPSEDQLGLRTEEFQNHLEARKQRIFGALADPVNHERTTPLRNLLNPPAPAWVNSGSAFNEKTFQDAKHHQNAFEIYYCWTGDFTIEWKCNSDSGWTPQPLHLSSGEWALIPPGFCLVVTGKSSFVSVAFKSSVSTIANGGKLLGTNCSYFRDQLCAVGNDCAARQYLRASYLSRIKDPNQPLDDEMVRTELRSFIP